MKWWLGKFFKEWILIEKWKLWEFSKELWNVKELNKLAELFIKPANEGLKMNVIDSLEIYYQNIKPK